MTRRFLLISTFLMAVCASSAFAAEFLIQGAVRGITWDAQDGAVQAVAAQGDSQSTALHPPRLAHVYLSKGSLPDAFAREEVAADGSFSITADRPGLVKLYVSAAGYQTLQTQLLLGATDIADTIALDIELARTALPENIEAFLLRPLGPQGNLQRAIEMQIDADGNFGTEIVLDSNQSQLTYRMAGVYRDAGAGRAVFAWSDPSAETLELGNDGLYRSVRLRDSDSSNSLKFEWQLPQSHSDRPKIEFADKLAGLFSVICQGIRSKKPFNSLVTHRATQPRSAILAERRAPIRRVLLLAYLAGVHSGDLESDSTATRMAFRDIDPASVLWSIRPELLWNDWYCTHDSIDCRNYIERVYAEHPLPDVRAYILYKKIQLTSDADESARLLDSLKVNFPESAYLDLALVNSSAAGPLLAGKIIPDFEMRDLDSLDRIFTPESLRGNVVLFDFWSTWCRECVGGIDSLAAAWQLYRNYGLRVISIAFEPDAGSVRKFHRQRKPMPWFNVLKKDGPQSDIARAFEIRGLPLTVLMDEDGRIIASGQELRGQKLMDILAETFAERIEE